MSVVYTTNLGLGKQTDEANWGGVERQNWQRVEDRLAGTASTGPSTASQVGAFIGQRFFDWSKLQEHISAAGATTATGSSWFEGWSFSTQGGPKLANGQSLYGLTSATAEQALLSLATDNKTVLTFASSAGLEFRGTGGSVLASITSAGFVLSGTNGEGTRTTSTGTPSGGSNGDIWYEVDS